MPKEKNPADFIRPLYLNGLHGRILRLPPKNKKGEIMYIQGHHTSLERNFGVALFLNQFGGVTVPDLPGFGGMDSFYKIGEEPTLDNLADYLAAVIKLRYRNRQKFVLCGLSLGFMIITRMLQKYPEIAKQVSALVSFAGFVDKDDFNYMRKPFTYWSFRTGSWLFSFRPTAAFLKYLAFRGPIIRLGYKIFEPLFVKSANSKMRDASPEERQRRINFEVYLWQCNDPRTYMSVAHTMLKLNMGGRHVDSRVYHISVAGDRYFDNLQVEQHMRQIFKDFVLIEASPPAHAPSIIATPEEAADFFPEQLRKILNRAA